ncbi:MAG TPA: TetR/AcrR family transcriptional regulator [Bryobacteraceae bacterium]|nr:TetR/AcrR family transcriptional regulator [Bryobacteraceae bacterium]
MKRKPPYHHGNLKKALLGAAVKVIAKVGPRAFTLREVARLAKVSHNAPYRHFRDKEELLAAVAAEGFERLADSMIESSAPSSDALDALLLSGRGYVQFALRWPEHFSVMFDQHEGFDAYPEYAASGQRAFHVLVDRIVAAQQAGQLPAGDATPLALTAWSMVHGIAKLAISGLLPFDKEDAVLEFTAFATRALGEGLRNLTW